MGRKARYIKYNKVKASFLHVAKEYRAGRKPFFLGKTCNSEKVC